MRVGFARNCIRSRPFGGAAARKSSYSQIEAAPKKVDRTALSDEACAKAIKHTFNRNQDSPQSVGRLRIVFAMGYIGFEPDWVWYLNGHCPNPNIYVHSAECGHKQLVEVGDRARLE